MNKKLETGNIKGKQYALVNTRLKYFREHYKGYGLSTEIVSLTEKRVVLKTVITDDNKNVVSTGIAYEDHGSSNVNKTSFIENCETSSVGRALANLGIAIEGSVASYEEVYNAMYGDYIKAVEFCLSKNIKKEDIMDALRALIKLNS